MRTDWLIDKGGFKFDSLTEDFEMEIEIINDGGRILWNDHASIYDEKPEKTKVGMIQRHRWIKGHWYVAFKQILPLTKKFFMTIDIKYLDKIFFLMSMGKAFHILLIFIVLIINIIFLTYHHMLISTLAALNIIGALHILNEYMFYITGVNALLIIYSFVILPMYSVYVKLRNINPIKIVLSLQWFMITDFIVQLFGLFTLPNQQTWIRTPHSKVSIETNEDAYHTPGTYEHDNQPAIQVPEVGLNTSNHIIEQHK